MDRSKVYYLASPFSTPGKGRMDYELLKEERHHTVEYVAMQLYELGFVLVEPIASSYYKSIHFNAPGNYEYWKVRDRKLIEACDALMVCLMPGWDESVGVTDEIEYAKSLGKGIFYITLKQNDKILGIGPA